MHFENVFTPTTSTGPVRRLIRGACCVALAGVPLLIAGCNETTPDEPVRTTSQGISVMTALHAESDADAFRFDIDEVSCADGTVIEEDVRNSDVWLEDMLLPGGNPTFENKPYDEDSGHLFADRYFLLDAGCYDVSATPLKGAGGAESDDCVGASRSGVEVFDGHTTEIHLIAQCANDPVGGLDVIASLNHAPQVIDLEFQPSKFTKICEPTTACLTVSDPDGDPLEIEWKLTSGEDDDEETVVTSTSSGNEVTSCVEVNADTPGTYEYEATVYDLLHDATSDSLIRFETYYDSRGTPDQESRDSLEFPVHVGENEGVTCEITSPITNPPGDDDDDDDGDDDDGDDDDDDDDDDDGDDDDDDQCTESCTISRTRAGNQYADITVTFRCDEIDVTSTKDLSNVVLLFEDGKTERFEGLTGKTGTFSGTGIHDDDEIVSVWVKSGAFQSGDGPGFGELFDADACAAD